MVRLVYQRIKHVNTHVKPSLMHTICGNKIPTNGRWTNSI